MSHGNGKQNLGHMPRTAHMLIVAINSSSCHWPLRRLRKGLDMGLDTRLWVHFVSHWRLSPRSSCGMVEHGGNALNTLKANEAPRTCILSEFSLQQANAV